MDKYDFLTADYDMCYYDLIMLIDEFFPDSELNENQKNLLLSALVGNYDPLDTQAIPKAFSIQTFWEEQTDKSAQAIVLKNNYITISGRLLFLLSAIGSGIMPLVLEQCSSGAPLSGVFMVSAVATSASCVVALSSWLRSIEKLEDDDFCVYMQALTHFHQYKSFSMQELISWFPECGKTCNMHNNKWECDFLCKKTDNCMIKFAKDEHTDEFIETKYFIEESIKSLRAKGLLVREKVVCTDVDGITPDDKYRFHFVH